MGNQKYLMNIAVNTAVLLLPNAHARLPSPYSGVCDKLVTSCYLAQQLSCKDCDAYAGTKANMNRC
jgi:hypothetical protein